MKEELKPYKKRISICRIPDPDTGEKKQIKETVTVLAKNKKEANEKFDDIKRSRRAQLLNIKEQCSLSDVIKCFYEDMQYRITTVVKRKWYRKIIEEKFGDILISTIEGDDIKQFLRDLRDENGYSEETLRNFRRQLSDFFEYAEINKYITENPMKELKKFDIGKKVNLRRNHNKFSPEDTKEVVRYILNHKTNRSYSLELKLQIMLSLDGSLRPIELYALTWNDINLDEGSMTIDKDLSVISHKEAEEFDVDRMTIGNTKTYGSSRKIPLSKRTLSLLTEYKSDCEKFLQNHKLPNSDRILFFQRRNIDKIGKVIYAYGSGLRNRLSDVKEYLLPDKKDVSVSAYSLRKLSDTERKNAAGIPYRVSEYLMGHNKNALDLRYVKDYFPLAKECMPVWEKILDGIIGNKTV